MPEPTLYLFDGFNILNAGDFADVRELRDALASFVALRGARGILVFDGRGEDAEYGPLQVRYSANADSLLERLAVEHRETERVCLVSSDNAVRGTAGQEVSKVSSRQLVEELAPVRDREPPRAVLGDRLDDETRERLEQLRRGEGVPSETAEATFQRLEDLWAAAIVRRDVAAAERLLAHDFLLTSGGGVSGFMPRAEWLGALRQIETRALACAVLRARVLGSTAVVHARLRWEASLGERDLTGTYVVVDVFTRAGGSWRAAWRISTRLPN